MNLTTLISKLETQVRIAERIASRYQARAEVLREKLDKVAYLLSGKALEKVVKVAQAASKSNGRRRGMSAAGRARIAEAQRQRWAKIHAKTGGKKAVVKPAAAKRGRRRGHLSAAGRAAIIAGQQRRWAAKGKAS